MSICSVNAKKTDSGLSLFREFKNPHLQGCQRYRTLCLWERFLRLFEVILIRKFSSHSISIKRLEFKLIGHFRVGIYPWHPCACNFKIWFDQYKIYFHLIMFIKLIIFIFSWAILRQLFIHNIKSLQKLDNNAPTIK